MKVLWCPLCNDLFRLKVEEVRACMCANTKGKYNSDGDTATWNGNGYMFGISNFDLEDIFDGVEERAEYWVYPTSNGKVTVQGDL